MKGNGRTQGKGFGYVMTVPTAALLIVAATGVYDYRNAPFKGAHENARTEGYSAQQSGPYCVMEGVWHNWEEDETITLGCLEVKGNVRDGSYSSATGPRATSDFSMSGTYDLDSGSMQVIGKDREGRDIKFTTPPMCVDDTEYPTQMIFIDKSGMKSLYIWKPAATAELPAHHLD